MELLTRNNFEGWMQKLMERLDRQDELLLAMKAEGNSPLSRKASAFSTGFGILLQKS